MVSCRRLLTWNKIRKSTICTQNTERLSVIKFWASKACHAPQPKFGWTRFMQIIFVVIASTSFSLLCALFRVLSHQFKNVNRSLEIVHKCNNFNATSPNTILKHLFTILLSSQIILRTSNRKQFFRSQKLTPLQKQGTLALST